MFSRLSLPQRGALVLVGMTLIWGTTFPAMKYLHSDLHALQIMLVRFGIAALLFFPLCVRLRSREWRWGIPLGIVMFASFFLQIEGLAYTSSNRNAFLTGLNVLMVPVIGMLIGKGIASGRLWLACAMAGVGMALLFYEDAPWNYGDTLTVLSAVLYAIYILIMDAATDPDAVAPEHAIRPTRLAAVQVQSVALLCVLGLLWRDGSLHPIYSALLAADWTDWVALMYLALIASVFAIVMQAWGQQYVGAVHSAVIYGLEPVFAALAAWVLINEVLTGWALLGAALIVTALILSQLGQQDRD